MEQEERGCITLKLIHLDAFDGFLILGHSKPPMPLEAMHGLYPWQSITLK